MFVKTAISFGHYFWSPYSFVVLALVSFAEAFLFYRFLPANSGTSTFNRILLAVLVGNTTSFLCEYYLSVFLNGGYRVLVWIPWVKIIGGWDLHAYLISF